MPCFYGRFRRKLTILKGKMAILRGQDNHFEGCKGFLGQRELSRKMAIK